MSGQLGSVLKTTDGGKNWFDQTVETDYADDNQTFIKCLYAFDDLHVCSVGGGGKIYSTTDGGNNWLKKTTGNPIWLTSGSFLDDSSGWALGGISGIMKTTNGGEDWNVYPSNTSDWLTAICFVSKNIGYAVGWFGRIIKTTDGGINWFSLNNPENYNLNTVKFFDEDTGLVGGNEGILRTTDGGKSWSNYEIDDFYGIRSFSFINDKIGWAAAIITYFTSDGGINWNPVWILQGHLPEYESICFIDSSTAWAAGNYGKIVKTTDGGTHWTDQVNNTNLNFYSIAFIDSENGWAVGDSGTIISTNDGGVSWRKMIPLTHESLNYIGFINRTTGWIIGNGGTILKTNNANITGIKNRIDAEIPSGFRLFQNYPNQFNPTTRIEYSIPNSSFVTLKVYDVLGREVAVLINEEKHAGNYEVEFNGKNLSSGIYFYKLQAGNYSSVKKMILMK
jgi:photosystem II stability/assembly factor-like uncharacterized protein